MDLIHRVTTGTIANTNSIAALAQLVEQRFCIHRFLRAALAQLVEQLFCKEKVPGSSPGSGSQKMI